MSDINNRRHQRDSLFLLSPCHFDSDGTTQQVKIRNLSSSGFLAECAHQPVEGAIVTAELRNIGKVSGVVAWVHGTRFGVALTHSIDPSLARVPAITAEKREYYAGGPVGTLRRPEDNARLRKI